MISATALCRTLIVAALAALLAFAPAHAQQLVTIVTTTVSWTYEENIEDDGILLDETVSAASGSAGISGGSGASRSRYSMMIVASNSARSPSTRSGTLPNGQCARSHYICCGRPGPAPRKPNP